MKKGEDIRDRLRTGMIVRVHQKIKDVNRKGEERERIQIFEGIVIAMKHGNEAGATFTVRKVSNGVGVEKIFPLHSPLIDTVELVREMDVRQAKAGYLRDYKKKLKERKSHRGAAAAKAKETDTASISELIGEVKDEEPKTEDAPKEATAEPKGEDKIEEKEAPKKEEKEDAKETKEAK